MLSWSERLILWNQYEILKRLEPDSVGEYEVSQEIVARGYEQFYGDLNTLVEKEGVPFEVTAEVMEILDLFRAIKFSCKKLGYSPKSSYAKFDGFDGNNEAEHYAAAQFLRGPMRRWVELEDRPDNSHHMVLPRYQRMVAAWNRQGREYDLTAKQIEEIAESAALKS